MTLLNCSNNVIKHQMTELIFKSFPEERIQEGAMNMIVNSACAGAQRAVKLTQVQ